MRAPAANRERKMQCCRLMSQSITHLQFSRATCTSLPALLSAPLVLPAESGEVRRGVHLVASATPLGEMPVMWCVDRAFSQQQCRNPVVSHCAVHFQASVALQRHGAAHEGRPGVPCYLEVRHAQRSKPLEVKCLVFDITNACLKCQAPRLYSMPMLLLWCDRVGP